MIYAVVTSAVNTPHGVFSADERLLQTVETYKSIRSYLPDVKIITVESSSEQLSTLQHQRMSHHSDHLINLISDDYLRDLYKKWNTVDSICKNLCESHALNTALTNFRFEDDSIILKLSGRYLLNDDFKLNYLTGKLTLVGPVPCASPPHFSEIKHWYSVRGMVWGSELQDTISKAYANIHQEILDHIKNGGYCDIEHAIYKHIPQEIINSVPQGTFGLKGTLAPNGSEVKD